MMATITPNRPKAYPNISIISTFTNVDGVYESANAQPDPLTPTQTPQNKFDKPTERPAPNMA